MYLRQKFTAKWQSNQLKQQNVNLFAHKINVSIKFAAVSLPVCEPSEARQFGGTNLAGDNLAGQICWQANLSASQFVGKINKNDLPSLALKRQQKSFVMSQRQLKRQL